MYVCIYYDNDSIIKKGNINSILFFYFNNNNNNNSKNIWKDSQFEQST